MDAEVAPEEPFGPYVVYERLGVGGMATVHRALERGVEGFERIVALKRLLPHLAEDATFIKSFVREAKLASLLNHANIVQIFELGRVGPEYFISMEYIDGRDVRQILRQARKVTGPPPLHVSVGLLLQLCDALDYAHSKVDEQGQPLGLVHRDVSPSNLLVTSSGHLKVIDFGIAKAQSQQLRTQTGRVKGKLAYMAPEAISGAKDLDARSDLFAAGVIAHELLTARPLFASKNEYQTLLKVQRGDIMPPSTYNPKVPPELDAIVLQALARDADDRFSTALELREALLRVKHLHKLATGHRDIATWLSYAFSQGTPAGDPSASMMGIAVPPVNVARRPTPRPDEEEAVEVAWGGGEDKESADPVLLDEVPDVSDKHLAPRMDSAVDLDDDIPPSRPSDGRRPHGSTQPPRDNAHLSVPAGLGRPGTQPPATRAKTQSNDPVVAVPRTISPGSVSVPMPASSTMPARVAAATMPPPIAVSAPRMRSSTMTGSMAKVDPADLDDAPLVDRTASPFGAASGRGQAASLERASTKSVAPSRTSTQSGVADALAAARDAERLLDDPSGTLHGTEPSDTAPSMPAIAVSRASTPPPNRLTPVPRTPTDRLTPVPRAEAAPSTKPGVPVARNTPPPMRVTPVPERSTPVERPSIPPSLGDRRVSARMVAESDAAASAAATVPSLAGDNAEFTPTPAPKVGRRRPNSTGSNIPRTKPGVAPARAATSVNRAASTAALTETRPVPTFGSAIVERQTSSKTWMVLLGLAVLGGGGAAAWYLTRNPAKPASSEAKPGAAQPLPGKIKFDTQPVDAEITVEGQPMHAGAPWALPLPPGTYPVRITRAGYKTWETSIELSASETATLRVVLEPLPAEGSADTATLSLDSTPAGLEAVVDNVKLPGLTPLKTSIAPGSHVIVLRQHGVDVWKHSLIAQANADYEFSPSMTAEKLRERQQRLDRTDESAEEPVVPTPPVTPPTVVTPPDAAPAAPVVHDAAVATTVVPPPVTPKPPPPVVVTPPPVTPKPVTPTPNANPNPVVVAPTAVKRISGDIPTLSSTHKEEMPSVISAKLCINAAGGVMSVNLITKLEKRTASDLSDAIRTWKYSPYLKSGIAVPACFVVSMRTK